MQPSTYYGGYSHSILLTVFTATKKSNRIVNTSTVTFRADLSVFFKKNGLFESVLPVILTIPVR